MAETNGYPYLHDASANTTVHVSNAFIAVCVFASQKSNEVSPVGRTHIIVRLQTRIRRKMERRFRGFRICVGWISTTRIYVVGFHVLD